jgi:hypothetical protein
LDMRNLPALQNLPGRPCSADQHVVRGNSA